MARNRGARSITEVEVSAIGAVLSVDFDGVDQLREQISAISSVRSSCECGCGTISLDVDRQRAPASTFQGSQAPVEALFSPVEDGAEHSAGLLLWIRDGYLDELEVYSTTERGEAIPTTAELSVYHRDDPSNPVTYAGRD